MRWVSGLMSGLAMLVLVRSVAAQSRDSPGVKTDREMRYERQRTGATPDEWARRLADERPEVRLETVKALAESDDAKAPDLLVQAVEDPDPRVAAAAVDALGRIGAKDSSSFLAQRLFLAATNPALRQRILIALGRIRDPAAARPILDFIQGEGDPQLRGTGLRVIGEIGDDTALADLRRFAEGENDPQVKALANEAVVKIESRRAQPQGSGSR